ATCFTSSFVISIDFSSVFFGNQTYNFMFHTHLTQEKEQIFELVFCQFGQRLSDKIAKPRYP
ncbi:MAG: hypothetical protein WA075_00600, partial [Lactococcus raffinolactis]